MRYTMNIRMKTINIPSGSFNFLYVSMSKYLNNLRTLMITTMNMMISRKYRNTSKLEPIIYRILNSSLMPSLYSCILQASSNYSHSNMIGICIKLKIMLRMISMNMRPLVAFELSSLSFIMISVLTVEPLSVLLLSSSAISFIVYDSLTESSNYSAFDYLKLSF